MIGAFLALVYAISFSKCVNVIVDDNVGNDEQCAQDQTKPCQTLEGALAIEGVTLIQYGQQNATVKIDPQTIGHLDELTIVTDTSIQYPFSQKDTNSQLLLSFTDVKALTLTTLTFAAKTQGSIQVSGSTTFSMQGCTFDANTQNGSIGIISPFITIRNVDTVNIDQYAPESRNDDPIVNKFTNFKAVGCAGIDVDNVQTFTLGHTTMDSLQGSCGVGVRVGSNVTSLTFDTATFSSITTRNNTEIGNGGGVLLSPTTVENPSCKFIGCTFSVCEALPGEGGAIYAERSVTIDTCTFDRPNSYATATIVVVDGSSTVTTTESGVTTSVDVEIINTTFNGENRLNAPHESERANRDYVKEGLLHLIQCNSLTITGVDNHRSYFMNTNSQVENGAIFCESVVSISISNTMFNHTRGKTGSCLYSKPFNGSILPDPTIVLTDVICNGSVTADMDSGTYGQMVDVVSCASLIVTGCNFLKHHATNAGGGIYVAACSGEFNVTSTTFTQTNGSTGGAIYIGSSVVKSFIEKVNISSCSVNTYGGAIAIEATSKSEMTVSISEIVVDTCTAICGAAININENGGASAATVTIDNSAFELNTASEIGGAIAIQRVGVRSSFTILPATRIDQRNQEAAPFTITNCNFTENICQSEDYSGGTFAFTNEPCGGAIAARSGAALTSNAGGVVVDISGCSFIKSSNGAVATENGMPMQITDSTFTDNYALLSTIKQPFNAGCQNSSLTIYPAQENFPLLCDDTCNTSMPADAAKCYTPTPTNISVNVTSMKVRVYPRMNPVSFKGSNLFPYKPILAVSLNNTVPPPLTNSMLRRIRSNAQVSSNDEVKYVYASLATNTPENENDVQLVLDHTINLGDLKETYPPMIYLFVTTDGGRTWNDNQEGFPTMSIRFDPKGVEDDDDGMGLGSIFAIIIGILGFLLLIAMIVYEIIRRKNLSSSSSSRQQGSRHSDPASRNLLSEDERGTPHYSA